MTWVSVYYGHSICVKIQNLNHHYYPTYYSFPEVLRIGFHLKFRKFNFQYPIFKYKAKQFSFCISFACNCYLYLLFPIPKYYCCVLLYWVVFPWKSRFKVFCNVVSLAWILHILCSNYYALGYQWQLADKIKLNFEDASSAFLFFPFSIHSVWPSMQLITLRAHVIKDSTPHPPG